ncbi:hypothetical protein AAZX31_19G248100 [Glycine max]
MNFDLPNFLNLSIVVDAFKLLRVMFKNLMLFRGRKLEGKLLLKVLFYRFKKENEVREEMGFTFPLILQLEVVDIGKFFGTQKARLYGSKGLRNWRGEAGW